MVMRLAEVVERALVAIEAMVASDRGSESKVMVGDFLGAGSGE